ncbi:hemerythrin domain-containing protein [Nitrososphaera viennensis]|uniref:Hemerythrin HHE cation binding domain protein n=2 Tax=Nitrososphaera viennensis TaxID=1034015 RepID=A0A060HR94_9ARCH|nr:hemerythrin domain-containing protein [Nitrososphaera viennensis]AIC16036.1 Hemerythrin HHE cation binding domain protein [Nitrososphaera viennensis EN76]UVS68009.1 hemerythrin domain-containing protein [Nitrososphaera viennensis]
MSTRELVQDHATVRRIRDIAQKCSDRLYAGDDIPLEEIEIISVVIEEFVDAFHHGKEEKAYFPANERKSGDYAEEVRKFKIEHEFGRRVAGMMLRSLKKWKSGVVDGREPVARFLKTYAAFVTDHTGKEEKFFEMVEEMRSISSEEDRQILRHYEACRIDVGGSARVQELLRLVEYLEEREWMKKKK